MKKEKNLPGILELILLALLVLTTLGILEGYPFLLLFLIAVCLVILLVCVMIIWFLWRW